MASEVLLPPWSLDLVPDQGGSQPHNERVVDAIEALTPKQREVIDGLFFERLTERPLARRLGITQQQVNRRKQRALRRMRRYLEDDRS